MFESEFFSISKRLLQACGLSSNLEFDEVQGGFKRPSLFVPPVEVETDTPAIGSVRFEYSLFAKVYDVSTSEAARRAIAAAQAISMDNFVISLYDAEGNATGQNLRLADISTKKLDACVAQIYIRWKSLYALPKAEETKAKSFIRNLNLK